MRAVLDANVLISALLSPTGTPAALLRRWFDGEFELVIYALLLAELARALAHPKVRLRVEGKEAEAFVELLRRAATVLDDPVATTTLRSRDPGDEYLLALAEAGGAILVTGDKDLLAAKVLPVMSPRAFMGKLSAP